MTGRPGRRTLRELAPAMPDSNVASSFLRGLTAGALIGAAIAGSALLQRRRSARVIEDSDSKSTVQRPQAKP
jgi:hypothetical protein